MSRMSRAAKAALALAGAACLTTGIAEASNMGFKLERRFDLQRRANGTPLPNIYWVAFPWFNGLGDVGFYDNAARTGCCVGDTGCAAGDGAITAVDFICDNWTARRNPGQEGFFQFSYIETSNCQPVGMTGAIVAGRVRFTGTNFPQASIPIGYQVNVGSGSATVTPQNPAVIVGSHDPAFPGVTIAPSAGCGTTAQQATLLSMPYHTIFQVSDEILCGLRGTDWTPDPVTGNPDRCFDTTTVPPSATGLFDNVHPLQVATFDNAFGGPRGRTVAIVAGRLRFTGNAFDLVPGEAYKVIIDRLHTATIMQWPHY